MILTDEHALLESLSTGTRRALMNPLRADSTNFTQTKGECPTVLKIRLCTQGAVAILTRLLNIESALYWGRMSTPAHARFW